MAATSADWIRSKALDPYRPELVEAAKWVRTAMAAKNTLTRASLSSHSSSGSQPLEGETPPPEETLGSSETPEDANLSTATPGTRLLVLEPPSDDGADVSKGATQGIDKSVLSIGEARRYRDKAHLRFIASQSCLICGRLPSDPHHVRFAQKRALGRKVSDEFTVPLCQLHHRELRRWGAIIEIVSSRILGADLARIV